MAPRIARVARKLKAALSEYLARVKADEEVVVTERGKPIAKLVPIRDDGATTRHTSSTSPGPASYGSAPRGSRTGSGRYPGRETGAAPPCRR